jgi:hypothetical protein
MKQHTRPRSCGKLFVVSGRLDPRGWGQPMSTIYLSSTYEDLKDHRAAVAQVLRRAGHTVIGMEDYAAYDERPRDKCVADVVRSDLYVGLFAWRYGFVPKDNNPFGTSITQLEYQAAADGKRLVFLLSKDAPWPPAHIDAFAAEDQGRRMREFREQLVLVHGTNFFVTPDELAGKVLAAVSSHAAKLVLPQVVRHMQRTQLGVVANMADLETSEPKGVRETIEQARNATVLGLDFTSTTWWSTRLLLVTLLATDHTEAEVFAFLDRERFVGTARLGSVRRALAALPGHSVVQAAYGAGMAKEPPPATVQGIVEAIAEKLPIDEEEKVKINVTEADLRRWLGDKLCDDAILDPRGAPTLVDLYDLTTKRAPFVALLQGGTIENFVDRRELATRVAGAFLRDQLPRK